MKAHLLGMFVLEDDGIAINNLSPRQQSLLAYLLLKRQHPQSRQQIAFLFWPDSPEAQAQTNLRQLLFHLRQVISFDNDYWHITKKTIQWRADNFDFFDVAQFETFIAQADVATSTSEATHLLTQAIALYHGDLLPTCYDEWIPPERERLRALYLKAQERLLYLLEQQEDFKTAIHYAERLLQQDPLQEMTYRTLMRLYTLDNKRPHALRIYQRFVTLLEQELGVTPEPATRWQYEQILKLDTSTVGKAGVNTSLLALPLIGRKREWARFQQIWQQKVSQQPHFLLVQGEAGIGKTRFLEEIAQWANLQGSVTAFTRSYAAQGGLAYGPVTAWLRTVGLQSQPHSLDDLWLSEISRLLPELLLTNPHITPPQPLTDSWQQQRFYEALFRAFMAQSLEQPLVLILDDLQWSDQETLSWLSYLLHHTSASPLLLIGAIRSGTVTAQHPLQTWLAELRQEQRMTDIRLRPLDEADSTLLAQQLSPNSLSTELSTMLFRETEGNPLFIIEMTRSALAKPESERSLSTTETRWLSTALPHRIQTMIEARLEQLSSTALDLAERAAAIGREFTWDVLARLPHGFSNETLIEALDELWQRHIIREQGSTSYDFSHDKIRDVVYSRLSQARRRLIHQQIAEALLTLHVANPSLVSAQVAGQYELAYLPQQAILYYQQAAEQAQHIYANREVVRLLTKVLQLLSELPAHQERDRFEIDLRISLAVSLVALTSYNTPEVFEQYQRVLSLCQRLKQLPDPRALRGLALAHILQADFPQCEDLGQQILDLAQADKNNLLSVEGHYVLGVTAHWQGKFHTSRHHLEQALAHFQTEQRTVHIHTYAQDPEVVCLVRLGLTMWHLGYPDQAVRYAEQAVEQAKINSHPFSLEYAVHITEILYDQRQELEQLKAKTETLLALIDQPNVSNYIYTVAIFFDAWIASWRGEYENSIRVIRQIIQDRRNNNIYLGVPYLIHRLAIVYWRSGQEKQALDTIETALTLIEQRGEVCWVPELMHTKGIILWAQNTPIAEVANCFNQAIDVARQQEAKMMELRASVSLCRLWQAVGDTERLAHTLQMLKSLYSWFTEGFDTVDLQDARALLSELS